MCPVCRARFRGSKDCSRCGADLTVVMHLMVSAWRMRQAARDAIAQGNPHTARQFASQAEEICHTEAGATRQRQNGSNGENTAATLPERLFGILAIAVLVSIGIIRIGRIVLGLLRTGIELAIQRIVIARRIVRSPPRASSLKMVVASKPINVAIG